MGDTREGYLDLSGASSRRCLISHLALSLETPSPPLLTPQKEPGAMSHGVPAFHPQRVHQISNEACEESKQDFCRDLSTSKESVAKECVAAHRAPAVVSTRASLVTLLAPPRRPFPRPRTCALALQDKKFGGQIADRLVGVAAVDLRPGAQRSCCVPAAECLGTALLHSSDAHKICF